jgi:hypothetical protein
MKRLLLIPAAALAVFLAARALVPASHDLDAYIIQVGVLASLAFAGGMAAGHRFERGDYLRTAWYVVSASYLPLVGSAALRWLDPTSSSEKIGLARGLLTLVANFLGAVSMWLFARAYRIAGIDLGSRAKKVTAGVVAGAIALAIAGVEMYQAASALGGGDYTAMVDLFGAVGDVVTLALIAPILLTALALRGGLLMWPWILIAAANITWLFDDAQGLIAQLLSSDAALATERWSQMWRVLACALMFTAGLAQRAVLAPEPPEATRPPS